MNEILKIGYYSIYEVPIKDGYKYIVDSGKTIHIKRFNKYIYNKNRDLKEFPSLILAKKYIKDKLIKKSKAKQSKITKLPKSLYLVIIKEEVTNSFFVKVGITSKRFIIRRFSKSYGYDGYIVESILRRVDTPLAEELERSILNKLKLLTKKYRPKLKTFSGYSECFDYSNLEKIIEIFDSFIKEQ